MSTSGNVGDATSSPATQEEGLPQLRGQNEEIQSRNRDLRTETQELRDLLEGRMRGSGGNRGQGIARGEFSVREGASGAMKEMSPVEERRLCKPQVFRGQRISQAWASSPAGGRN